MSEESASKQIDTIIKLSKDWRGEILARLRRVVQETDPDIIEQVKYKKPSKPEGVPFWTHDGDVCFADTLKNAVRLTFSRGAVMHQHELFNTRLDSKAVRSIDFFEGDVIDEPGLKAIIKEAVTLNASRGH